MKGDLRCIEGRLFRHDPQWDDPDLETDVGQCPDCSGDGCADSDDDDDDDKDPVPHLVPADPPLYASPAECWLLWIVFILSTIGLVYIWVWAG